MLEGCQIIFVVLIATITTTEALLRPESVLADGSSKIFFRQGDQDFYGNNLTLRHASLPTGGKRAWIDGENPLPAGTLRQFLIYVHNVQSLPPPNNRIRLQIWRPQDLTIKRLKLVYEAIVEVEAFPHLERSTRSH